MGSNPCIDGDDDGSSLVLPVWGDGVSLLMITFFLLLILVTFTSTVFVFTAASFVSSDSSLLVADLLWLFDVKLCLDLLPLLDPSPSAFEEDSARNAAPRDQVLCCSSRCTKVLDCCCSS